MLKKDGVYTNTAFEGVKEALQAAVCPSCNGSGKQDDADLGDIAFNEWVCTDCTGTGFDSGNLFTLEGS